MYALPQSPGKSPPLLIECQPSIAGQQKLKYLVFMPRNRYDSCFAKPLVWGVESALPGVDQGLCRFVALVIFIPSLTLNTSVITLYLRWVQIYWKVLTQCFYSTYIFRPYLHICTLERLSLYSFVPSLLVECCYLLLGAGLPFSGGHGAKVSFVLDQLYSQAGSV